MDNSDTALSISLIESSPRSLLISARVGCSVVDPDSNPELRYSKTSFWGSVIPTHLAASQGTCNRKNGSCRLSRRLRRMVAASRVWFSVARGNVLETDS